MSSRLALLLPLLALPLVPRAVHAQLLAGVAVDGATRTPAVGLPVRLLRLAEGAAPALVDSGVTYERGIFQIMAPGPGVYQLEFGPANRRATRGPVDTLAADAQLQREYALPITSGGAEAPYLETEVQSPARFPARHRGPKLPDALRSTVRGETHFSVVSEFMVDEQGRADLASFRVVSTNAPLLVDGVRQTLQTTRFTPATIGGIAVRQVVRYPMVLTVRTETRMVRTPVP